MTSYSKNHQDCFELEVDLVTALLERNRCSHGRTKYFQRLSMAHRCIRRYALLELYSNVQTLEAELVELKLAEQKRRKREQVFWEIALSGEDAKRADAQHVDVRNRLQTIGLQTFKHIPEIISRLEYSAKAIFAEIARGFFLPFNSVAVAAAARIRTLSLRLAIQTLQSMPTLQSNYISVCNKELLWTPQQLQESLAVFHAMSATFAEETPSKEAMLNRSLMQLGSDLPGLTKGDVLNTEQSSLVAIMTEEGPVAVDETETTVVELNSAVLSGSSTPDDDLGEQLALDDDVLATSTDTLRSNGSKDQSQSRHEMDGNHELVQKVARKKKDKKRKSKVKDGKSGNTDSEARQGKKVKKTSTRGDFFDELFG
ncbi:hypothetical protein MPSEU_000696900 [Mayamaea pseudoterrestris]|nr:hypothetical protein MPSEU_000696900 [Mayamaea pseudoterrestris]